jgi:hypothetical protein
MSRLPFLGPLLALALAACGPLEIRISKAEGVKAISGSLTANFSGSAGTFHCGDTITGTDSTQQYTVTTSTVSGGCEFKFDQDVEVLSTADYATIKEFKDAVRLVDRVEIQVTRLDLFDDSGKRLEVSRFRDMEFTLNGQELLNLDQVRALPRTVVLQGDALNAIKDAVKNRRTCTAHVTAHLVLLDTDAHTGMRCEYESQPTLVLSSAAISG